MLIANCPWQRAEKGGFKNKFVILNEAPDLFKPSKVKKIAKTVEHYVKKYVFPNWRMTAEIEVFTPESNDGILAFGTSLDPHIAKGSYIPIYLVSDFNDNVGSDFAIAIHGNESGSVMNGPNMLYFLPPAPPSLPPYPNPTIGAPTLYTAIPYGTPFVVIPAGTVGTGNGINAAVARNEQDPSLGPTDFYQAFALALCQEVIQTMINPTGALYNGAGDPTGSAGDQLFLIVEATAPFSEGNDNIVWFEDLPMSNFAFPSYFFPFNNSGKYDLLHNSPAPFTPYKGTQFLLYQQTLVPGGGSTTDLEAGAYVSEPSDPYNIQFVLNGSIYTYEGWGLRAEKVEGSDAKMLYGLNSGVQARRQQPNLKAALGSTRHVHSRGVDSNHSKRDHKPSTKPHLLPFQYLDDDGVIVTRYKVINYIPNVLTQEQMETLSKPVVDFFNTRFYPYWNRKAELEVYTYPKLPKFDGSFIPLYMAKGAMANLATVWGQSTLTGAGDNLNNNPNALAGPLLTDYLIGVPPLPLGNPYLVSNDIFLELLGPEFVTEQYTALISHEMMELAIDPTYAYYYATSNPPEDLAILFSQWEMCDPEEADSVSQTKKGVTYAMNPFVLPSYFDAYLQNNLYDNTGFGNRALYPPMPRQQIVWQQQGDAMQVAWTVNNLDGTGDLMLWNIGNIYDINTYLYADIVMTPIDTTPLAPIYERLATPAPLY